MLLLDYGRIIALDAIGGYVKEKEAMGELSSEKRVLLYLIPIRAITLYLRR